MRTCSSLYGIGKNKSFACDPDSLDVPDTVDNHRKDGRRASSFDKAGSVTIEEMADSIISRSSHPFSMSPWNLARSSRKMFAFLGRAKITQVSVTFRFSSARGTVRSFSEVFSGQNFPFGSRFQTADLNIGSNVLRSNGDNTKSACEKNSLQEASSLTIHGLSEAVNISSSALGSVSLGRIEIASVFSFIDISTS